MSRYARHDKTSYLPGLLRFLAALETVALRACFERSEKPEDTSSYADYCHVERSETSEVT
jgi:hypothetical protein